MKEFYELVEKKYEKPINGYTVMGDMVEIIGEALDKANGNEYYYYNIVGYTPENGKPFVALKCKEKALYFMYCLARDRDIKPEYFDFDKRVEIEKFNSGEKGCEDNGH